MDIECNDLEEASKILDVLIGRRFENGSRLDEYQSEVTMRNGRMVFAESEERVQGRNGMEVIEAMRANDPYETATHMMPRLLADKAV